MTRPPVELSVVVPVFRNADTLAALVARLREALEPAVDGYEIVFVEDACPAGSAAVIDALASEYDVVRGIHLDRNRGQHAAVLIGLAAACGDWRVVMDADLQDPPEALPRLLAARDGSSAAIFAGRRGRYQGWGRLATSKLFKRALHLAAGVPADAGIFVLLRRDLVEQMLALPTTSPFIVAMVGCAGLPMRSLPVERDTRSLGESSYRSRDRLRSALRAFRCVAECRGWRAARPYLDVESIDFTRLRSSNPS